MSKDDFDHLTIRRTRQGAVQGDAQERQMLDAVNDTGSFRTRIRQNADGTSTRMRTKGGMPTFYTDEVETTTPEEPVCSIAMDSGVVDLQAADFRGIYPGAHDSGILSYTDYVYQHVASNGDALSTGPIMGKINPPSFKGTAPADHSVAKSFDASEGKDPYDKKRTSIVCPPSIFTGKMRMYVQSLYGRHDHGELFALANGASGPAVLFQMGSTAVLLDTNCGIFTEPTTCKHYLISVGASTITIYNLKASKCAEKLRKKLKDETVTLGNKVKIEAYILSQSYPDTTAGRVVELTGFDLPTSAMGYGWHFNYQGDKCDLVYTDYVGSGLNRSTHHRLTFAFNSEAEFWSMNPSVVEGPVTWKHRKHMHVICYPDWSYTGMRKLGVHSPAQPSGNAPFYAFYTRDTYNESSTGPLSATMGSTIQVCRYSASESTVPKGGTRSPSYANPDGGMKVFGGDSFVREIHNAYQSVNINVSCGDTSVLLREASYSSTVITHSGAVADVGADITYLPGSYGSGGTFIVDGGQGDSDNCLKYWISDEYEGDIYVCGQSEYTQNLGPYEEVSITVDDIRLLGYPGGNLVPSSYTDENYTAGNWYDARYISAAPFDDAEAFYIAGFQYHTRLETGTTRQIYGGSFWSAYGVRDYIGGPWRMVAMFAILGDHAHATNVVVSTTDFSDRNATQPPTTTAVVVANYGGEQAGIVETPSAFFDVTDDIAPVSVYHKSAASGTAGKSKDVNVDVGIGVSLADRPFTFVGWA